MKANEIQGYYPDLFEGKPTMIPDPDGGWVEHGAHRAVVDGLTSERPVAVAMTLQRGADETPADFFRRQVVAALQEVDLPARQATEGVTDE